MTNFRTEKRFDADSTCNVSSVSLFHGVCTSCSEPSSYQVSHVFFLRDLLAHFYTSLPPLPECCLVKLCCQSANCIKFPLSLIEKLLLSAAMWLPANDTGYALRCCVQLFYLKKSVLANQLALSCPVLFPYLQLVISLLFVLWLLFSAVLIYSCSVSAASVSLAVWHMI